MDDAHEFRLGILFSRKLQRLQVQHFVPGNGDFRRGGDPDPSFVALNPQEFHGDSQRGENDFVGFLAREHEHSIHSTSDNIGTAVSGPSFPPDRDGAFCNKGGNRGKINNLTAVC
jgi:hypothetical protein